MKFSLSFSLFVAIVSLLPFESRAKPRYLKREEAELQRLCKEALAEGGIITVFAGGDLPNADADVVKAFYSKFPGITLNITTDLSRHHNVSIDSQLAKSGDALEPDVIRLQPLHDIPHWKSNRYKSIGFKHTYAPYKDEEGYYWATNVFYFTDPIGNSRLKPKIT
ncbi:hypothetical protein K493DRAFT_359390 [Basidiobolus meristosporus CBS 931.73]|uniref:Uncharacterized protein n=1 Tax=Basidiobolus meristosporus CBS 931.73 TaxID=1314790 RepID=A0A1Y1XS58_9FUNG|nr:hypothetical protein K493DRAFT_359390 [Basidiobolus meristosporus CBS 931.73]|eukprot:ORX88568.1 hypothetical protein K493DRAFT_359390 [Basidiobolus meristosporus CBS 931.73]